VQGHKCNTAHKSKLLLLVAQLVEDLPGVSLALSLHAPNQALRQTIVPSARAYKLDKLMAAIDTYREKTGQKVSGGT
jgi:23S rRNA (adenine2503-C2)-methyltransferase